MMAEAMEPEAARQASAAAERAVSQKQINARHVASLLGRTAEALEQSATLAERHAQRREQAGRKEAAAEERRVARRAHEAAARARARAEEWLKLLKEREF
jgi:hypothetical protein